MKFTIVERKMKIDDDLRQYALRKVEKLDGISVRIPMQRSPSASCAASKR